MIQRGIASDHSRVEIVHVDEVQRRAPRRQALGGTFKELVCPQTAIAVPRGYNITHGAVCGAQLHHAGAL